MGEASRTRADAPVVTEKPLTGPALAVPEVVFLECLTSANGGISAMASAHAPFVYFDAAPFFGIDDGVCEMTLVSRRMTAQTLAGPVGTDLVTVAHLRCGVEALLRLRRAIDGILVLRQPSPSEAAN